jgi:hypothetical protein
MERRRLWWPVAGGFSTDTWERVALLAIPSTREKHRSILVVICDRRGGCIGDRSGTPHSHQEVHITPQDPE